MSKMRHDHTADTQWELISACLQQVDSTYKTGGRCMKTALALTVSCLSWCI